MARMRNFNAGNVNNAISNKAANNPFLAKLTNQNSTIEALIQDIYTPTSRVMSSDDSYEPMTSDNSPMEAYNNFKQSTQNTSQLDESTDILDLTREALEKFGNKSIIENERPQAAEAGGEEVRPEDETRKLTRMLVNARTPDEVQSVLADTFNHMREWQALAASGDKEAIKVVRKLGRLISRGNRKVSDLHKEIVMHQRQRRAEKAEKNQEAKRLELELKEAQRKRKERERRYLQERDNNNEDEESEFGPTMAETEAKIRQLAGAMAALKTNTVDIQISDSSIDGIAVSEGGGIQGAEVSGQESSDVA